MSIVNEGGGGGGPSVVSHRRRFINVACSFKMHGAIDAG